MNDAMDKPSTSPSRYRGRLTAVLLLGLLIAAPSQAASISYILDRSNDLPDGIDYLEVILSEGDNGAIDFQVDTLSALNDSAGGNFGIQKFAFNFAPELSFGDLTVTGLSNGWSVNSDRQMSAFGRFDVQLQGRGNSREDPLTFSVTGGESLWDFVALSGGNAGQGNMLFAAHVAGFNVDNNGHSTSSAYFAVVPIPAAVWLFASALGLLVFWRRRAAAVSRI